jgi:hypothetical protein
MSVAMIRESVASMGKARGPMRLDDDVIESLGIVSAYTGKSMKTLASEILRPVLLRMEQEQVQKRHGAPPPPKKPKG